MNWNLIVAILSSVSFLKVLCAEDTDQLPAHEPLVAMWCGKVNQHIDITTGQWVSDKNGHSMCSTSPDQVLKYCKHVYPKLQVHNIVEANKNVTIHTWCEPGNGNCDATNTVVPFRCLVGNFEADALLVPKGCRFEHLHRSNKCKSHDVWKGKAVEKCKEQGLVLSDSGVLIPCGTGLYTGVEFVCCPSETSDQPQTDSVQVVPTEDVEPTVAPTTVQPTSFLQKLEKEIKQFAKKVIPGKIGCNPKKYHDSREKLDKKHSNRMKVVIKQWEDAEKRYNLLHKDDPKQAEEMMAGVMERFKKTIASLEEQAKLERQQLHEEHHQCVQININDRRHKAIKTFIREIKKSSLDSNAVLSAVRKFVKICTEDRIHNRRHFDFVSKHSPDKVEELRGNLKEHLKLINMRVNDTMSLLYKLPEVMRKFSFELPDWAPKPVLPTDPPTEKPTEAPTTAWNPQTSKQDLIPLDLEKRFRGHLHKAEKRKHHRELGAHKHDGGIHHDPTDDPQEDEPEDERDFFGEPRSPATFAAVIGLSCGALVIMIVIIIAMAMRKSRSNNATKTVLVDADGEGNTEKQRLTDLQENGYENPTYKFYDY